MRVLEASSRAAVLDDLFRIYSHARMVGAGFQWITIPNELRMSSDESLDPVQMNMWCQFGHHMVKSRDSWVITPPGRPAE